MRVIGHEPSGWFLVEEGTRLLLDVNCSHGPVSYDFAMELSDAEVNEYLRQGSKFISELAEEIQYSAPGVRGNASSFRGRLLTVPRRDKMNTVIANWLKDQESALQPLIAADPGRLRQPIG